MCSRFGLPVTEMTQNPLLPSLLTRWNWKPCLRRRSNENVGADLGVRPGSAYHQSIYVGADLRVRPDSCGRTRRFAPTMGKCEILGEHITTGEHIGSPLQWINAKYWANTLPRVNT